MVLIVRLRGIWLAFSLLGLSSSAWGHGREVPRYVRTALDDDDVVSPARREPRRFRTTLDDPSQAAFPLDGGGRLIRVTLDDGADNYARLGPTQSRVRRVRTALD